MFDAIEQKFINLQFFKSMKRTIHRAIAIMPSFLAFKISGFFYKALVAYLFI